MALNTETWPESSIANRAKQCELLVAHIKSSMISYLLEIDVDPSTGPLTSQALYQHQYGLTRAKNFLADANGIRHGRLLDADTKAYLVAYSVKADGTPAYPSVASLNADISAANTAFASVTARTDDLVAITKSRGQAYDIDAKHTITFQTYSVADMAALRVSVAALIALLG